MSEYSAEQFVHWIRGYFDGTKAPRSAVIRRELARLGIVTRHTLVEGERGDIARRPEPPEQPSPQA